MKSRPKPQRDGEPPPEREQSAESSGVDLALIRGVGADGSTLKILRQREDRVESGIVRPVEDGKPIQGELVRLKPRKEFPLLCDVEVEYSPGQASPESDTKAPAEQDSTSRRGPAQVATDNYRKNWDAIYKRRPKSGVVN
jgi:hypothetical protein